MVSGLFRKVVGTKNSREIKRMGRVVTQINALEESTAALSNEDLKARTDALRTRLAGGATLEELLPEAFAAVREASRRTRDMRHFDVQLVGGIVMHTGRIAEMRTGEGKTVVAVLAAYLNALGGEGVHIVTVNDYLARRDAGWMGPIYEALGMTVGVIQSGQDSEAKRQAYQADVIYGTNNEFGFDYLRDNMAFRLEDRFQRPLHYAIVDEVDSILIDEARTPLIISGPAQESTDLYRKINRLAPKLKQQEMVEATLPARFGGEEVEDTGDFFVDEKNRQVELTERGARLRRGGTGAARSPRGGGQPLRADQPGAPAPRTGGPEGARPVSSRCRLHGHQRRDRHRGRAHRPRDARAALVRGSPPGRRGQGRRVHPERDPDPRLDHFPELLPPLREARGHDRHRGHRGLRVPPRSTASTSS